MMKKKEQFPLKTYTELLDWFRMQAMKNERAISGEITMAMKAYKERIEAAEESGGVS